MSDLKFKLNTDAEIPAVGLGAYTLSAMPTREPR